MGDAVSDFDVKVIDIARVCHDAHRAYCFTLGDYTHRSWAELADAVREPLYASVQEALARPQTAAQIHAIWAKQLIADGWVYGHVLDEERRIHPSLRPFETLLPSEQKKDRLFLAIVHALA